MTEFDAPPAEPLSQTVVYAVAAANDVDPLSLSERLYDCVDPDALDRLFEQTTAEIQGTVTFSMAGCRVEVSSDRTISVYKLHDQPSTAEAHA